MFEEDDYPKIPGGNWTMNSCVDRCFFCDDSCLFGWNMLATYWQIVMDKLDGRNPAPVNVGSLSHNFYQVSAINQQ